MSICRENGCFLSVKDKEEVLIRYYFQRGFDYSACNRNVYAYLHNRHREYRLRRRNANSDYAEIYLAIQQELDGPDCIRGYRAMWHTLRLDYGIQAPRRKVEGILRQLDPEGTALRKAHALRRRSYTNPGPNFAPHVNGGPIYFQSSGHVVEIFPLE